MTAILTGQRTSSSTTSQPSSSSSSTFSPPSSQPAVLITKQLPASAAGSSSGSGSRAVYAVTSESDNVTSSYEESPAEVLVKRAWRAVQAVLGSSVVQAVKEAINPPVAAVIAGDNCLSMIIVHSFVYIKGGGGHQEATFQHR